MRQRIVGMVAAVAVLAISLYMKVNSAQGTNTSTYYVVNVIIISATVAVALALSVVFSYLSRRKAAVGAVEDDFLPNRRDYFRIVYEPSQRPILRIAAPSLELTGEHEFEVLDISEHGLRFLNDQNVHFSDAVRGELIFVDGDSVPIEGTVVRETGAQLSLQLSETIPFRSVIKEQRRMITDRRYQAKLAEHPPDAKTETER